MPLSLLATQTKLHRAKQANTASASLSSISTHCLLTNQIYSNITTSSSASRRSLSIQIISQHRGLSSLPEDAAIPTTTLLNRVSAATAQEKIDARPDVPTDDRCCAQNPPQLGNRIVLCDSSSVSVMVSCVLRETKSSRNAP